MIKYFRNAFKITNDNIILTIPLVLCLLFLSIYLGFAKTTPDNIWAITLLVVTLLLMFAAFCAGWLYMVKKAVELSKKDFYIEEDKARESFALIKEFPVGVGEYFLPAIGGILFYTFLILVFLIGMYFLGIHLVGKIAI